MIVVVGILLYYKSQKAPHDPRFPAISISAPESLEPCALFLDLSATNGKFHL